MVLYPVENQKNDALVDALSLSKQGLNFGFHLQSND
jgi:hypothetical protein